MVFANSRSQTAVMFAALVMVIAMSVILRALVDLATARLTPWAPEIQSVSDKRE
jgi:putative hydroxymethylpyrimidine transport system permease protein